MAEHSHRSGRKSSRTQGRGYGGFLSHRGSLTSSKSLKETPTNEYIIYIYNMCRVYIYCECTIHLYHQLMSITWTYHDPHGSIGCFQHVPSASPTMQLGGREDSTRPAKQGFASQGWWIGIPEIISQGDSKFTLVAEPWAAAGGIRVTNLILGHLRRGLGQSNKVP